MKDAKRALRTVALCIMRFLQELNVVEITGDENPGEKSKDCALPCTD